MGNATPRVQGRKTAPELPYDSWCRTLGIPAIEADTTFVGELHGVFKHDGGFVFVIQQKKSDKPGCVVLTRNGVFKVQNHFPVRTDALEIFRPFSGHECCIDQIKHMAGSLQIVALFHIALDKVTRIPNSTHEAFNNPNVWSGYLVVEKKKVELSEQKWSYAEAMLPRWSSSLTLHMLPRLEPQRSVVVRANVDDAKHDMSQEQSLLAPLLGRNAPFAPLAPDDQDSINSASNQSLVPAHTAQVE